MSSPTLKTSILATEGNGRLADHRLATVLFFIVAGGMAFQQLIKVDWWQLLSRRRHSSGSGSSCTSHKKRRPSSCKRRQCGAATAAIIMDVPRQRFLITVALFGHCLFGILTSIWLANAIHGNTTYAFLVLSCVGSLLYQAGMMWYLSEVLWSLMNATAVDVAVAVDEAVVEPSPSPLTLPSAPSSPSPPPTPRWTWTVALLRKWVLFGLAWKVVLSVVSLILLFYKATTYGSLANFFVRGFIHVYRVDNITRASSILNLTGMRCVACCVALRWWAGCGAEQTSHFSPPPPLLHSSFPTYLPLCLPPDTTPTTPTTPTTAIHSAFTGPTHSTHEQAA